MTGVTYSKPAADVAAHTARLLADNAALLARQRRITRLLAGQPKRHACVLCATALAGSPAFSHRGVPYVACRACGHVQCALEPPPAYPGEEQEFGDIYRPLDAAAYRERTERIYRPKLDWVCRAAADAGLGDLLPRSWVEIGSGAGNFLDALLQDGATRVHGFEAEERLAAQANRALGKPLVRHFTGTPAAIVRDQPAEIYAAWFVLEHCADLRDLLSALGARPRGTVFMFAVPAFGLATLIDNALDTHFARSLDSVLHLQLFTDRSIRFALDLAGYDTAGEWIFGQDADDLFRALTVRLGNHMPEEFLGAQAAHLRNALGGIQQAIDRARLADARHILAVRK